MRKLIVAIILSVFLIQPVSAQTTAVRCPTQPKNQKGLNNIFFSFYKKTANVYSYLPKYLVLLDPVYTEGKPRCLTAQSYNAFVNMNDALYKDIGQNLVVTSAWRSTKTQLYFAKNRGEFAARPGRSEHQLGTTMDLDILGSKTEDYFGDSLAYQWMTIHAHEYGFVQSFNAEGEAVTGIPNEPWHWRFVGSTIATRVKAENRNINEFLYERKEAKKKGLTY